MKEKKQVNRLKNKIIIIALLIVLVLVGVGFYFNLNINERENNDQLVYEDPIDRNPNIKKDSLDKYNSKLFNHNLNKGLNSDYVGIVYFESGLIELPFVKGEDNDEYLRKNWETNEYDEEGSIFMDYECNLDSQNIVLYGHYVYPEFDPLRKNKFTPLAQLIDYNKYERNKDVYLFLGDEVRHYQIVSVYHTVLSEVDGVFYPEEDLKYYAPEFSQSYFKNYKSRIKEVEFYNTGIDFTNDDFYLTLQTCVENKDDTREIVLCKEIERITLE